MKRRFAIGAALLALLWTVLGVRPAEAQKSASPKFAWPVPGSVWVTEASTKGGQTAQVRYQVTLARDAKSKNLLLRLQNFSIVRIEGVDLKDPKMKKDLDQANKLAAAIPTLVISPEGRFVDVVEYEAMVDKVIASLPGLDPSVARMLKAPATITMMKQKSIDFWLIWVGAWLDARVTTAGATRNETQMFPMPDGSKVEGKVTYKHAGAAKGDPKLVQLEFESRIEGAEATAAMRRFFEKFADAAPGGHGGHDADAIASVSKVSTFRTITDPSTLRPKEAVSEAVMTVTSQKGEAQKQVERHSYQFDWK